MEMKIYPVCARCSTVMNPLLHEGVAPGFVMNGECYCTTCFKAHMEETLDWMRRVLDKDSEAVAEELGIAIIEIPED